MKEKYSNFRGATMIQVVRIEVNEGDGTPEDPTTRTVYYVDLEGNIIGHTDITERKFRGDL